jgi:hypothetical protein
MKSLWFWTKEDSVRLQEAEHLHEVLPIAQEVTRRIYEQTGSLPWMVSGPINHGGKRNRPENLKLFNQSIYKLDGIVDSLFNQIPMERTISKLSVPRESSHEPDPVGDIYLPLISKGYIGGLYALYNSLTSYGARREQETAKKNSVPVVPLRPDFELDGYPELTAEAYMKHRC